MTAAEQYAEERWPIFSDGSVYDTNADHQTTAVEAFNAGLDVAIASIIENAPALGFELDHTGQERPLEAAYVEGIRDALAVVQELRKEQSE